MLFTLGILFLLNPFPSFQTTVNEKRDLAGSNVTKANAVFTLFKAKTNAAPSKQGLHPTLKPNTVTVTILPTAVSNQKSTTANPARTTKSKLSFAVIQTTSPPTAKASKAAGTKTNRDKHKVNQTISAKLQPLSEVKPSNDKPGLTKAPKDQSTIIKQSSDSALKISENKTQHSTNQTTSGKSPSTSNERNPKDKSNQNNQSLNPSGGKIVKDKVTASGSQINSDIPNTNTDDSSKNKSIPNVPSSPPSGGKNTQDRTTVSGNQTIVDMHLPRSNEKSKYRPTPNVPSSPTSRTKTTKDKSLVLTNHTVFDSSLLSDEKSKGKAVSNTLLSPSGTTKTTGEKHKVSDNQTVVDTHLHRNDENTKDKLGSKEVETKRLGGSTTAKEIDNPVKIHAPIHATCKDNVAHSQPTKVVISINGQSSHTKEQELMLKPGAPLVMTHEISMLPGGCTGGCEVEMEALKERLTKLEKEMTFLKEKCPCSANCPNDCSGNGKCEKGKCVCSKGFMGPDCSKCAKDAECNKEHDKRKHSEEADTTPKVTSNNTKESVNPKEDLPQKKPTRKPPTTSSPTVAKFPSNNDKNKLEDTPGGNPKVTKASPTTSPKNKLEETTKKLPIKHPHLRDDPQSNMTLTTKKNTNSSSKNSDENKKKSEEQSGLINKNVSIKQKQDKRNKQPNESLKISSTEENHKGFENKTVTDYPGINTRRHGGLGSVKVVNISSSSFTLTWLAPKRMFKNFTVIRKEPQTDNDKEENEAFGEETNERHLMSGTRDSTEVQSESTNTTVFSIKSVESQGKTETKRILSVVPGNARSFEFSNLKANTRYIVHVFGTTTDRRSKIHRVTAITGPEPPTELVFSNVTESSLTVSWTKPKTIFTGFRVTYINIATGKSQFVNMGPQQSSAVLSALSAGSSYIISVITTNGRAQSDELTSVITTVPAPPTHLQVINVTENRAMLRWTPSLGKVDRFIVSYESLKTPNVTVTVMLSGNSVQYQLKGLQRDTLYKVKVRTQKNSLQSMGISTTFTTANVVKASEVGARSAVIGWKTSVIYHSYRVIYQAGKEEAREVILEPTVTEYKLTGLMPSSSYFVVVQGEKNGKYTSLVTSQFITGKLRFPFPTECSQELLNGALESGEVNIYPQGKGGRAVRVYCDMETDGGGWTVFQRRMNGKTDFYQTWSEYKTGFGNLSEEFWLGNELLHHLTNIGPVSLRVDLQSGNDTAYAHYTNFSVASEDRNYTLTVSGYTGTAGDSMRYHNGRPFSTRDKDPDPLGIHCAKAYIGGWWYKNCYKVNLNGLYGMNSKNQGIVWIDWKGKDFSIPFAEMKFRPSRFSPATHG